MSITRSIINITVLLERMHDKYHESCCRAFLYEKIVEGAAITNYSVVMKLANIANNIS